MVTSKVEIFRSDVPGIITCRLIKIAILKNTCEQLLLRFDKVDGGTIHKLNKQDAKFDVSQITLSL